MRKRIVPCLVIAALPWLISPATKVFAAEESNEQPPSAPAADSASAKPPLDIAQVVQNPALWPKEVTLLRPASFPVVLNGRELGHTTVPAGTDLKLNQVLATQVEVENEGATQFIPIASTDLLARATKISEALLPPSVAHAEPAPLPQPPAAVAPAGQPPPPPVPAVRVSNEKPVLPTQASTQRAPAASSSLSPLTGPVQGVDYRARALEVTAEIQQDFWMPERGLYSDKPNGQGGPTAAWGCGVMFSALVGAARNQPQPYLGILQQYFHGLDSYWDRKQPLGGYEPLPGNGDGHDKYFDDNEWLAITFLEAHELTRQPAYAQRAQETLTFILSGWDDTYLKGGIWWHEAHEKKVKAKNTCANAPAAVACLQMAKISPPAQAQMLIEEAAKIVNWTTTTLQQKNGLYADNKDIEGDGINKAQLTYNSALMIRAYLGLYRATGTHVYLQAAERISVAADSMVDKKTGVFYDQVKWAHLMAEADLALYRVTKQPYLLQRARRQADAYYDRWKKEGPGELITVASYARLLWLMADMQTDAGRNFWAKADAPTAGLMTSRFQ